MINHNLPTRSAVELGRTGSNEQIQRKVTGSGLRFFQYAGEALVLNFYTFSKDNVHLIVEGAIGSEALLEQSWKKNLPDIVHIQSYDCERRLLQHCDHIHPDALTFRVVLWLFHFLELDQESNQRWDFLGYIPMLDQGADASFLFLVFHLSPFVSVCVRSLGWSESPANIGKARGPVGWFKPLARIIKTHKFKLSLLKLSDKHGLDQSRVGSGFLPS